MTIDGRRTRTTLAEAIIQQLLAKAAKGDHRSTKLFCDLVRLTEMDSDARSHEEWLTFSIARTCRRRPIVIERSMRPFGKGKRKRASGVS